MYWTDWDRNAIFKANKFDGSKSDAVTPEDLVCGVDVNQSIKAATKYMLLIVYPLKTQHVIKLGLLN